MTTIAELINRWNSDEGKPYKGSLIDLRTYNENPSIGCMCAQGQVLHLVAGWTPEQLNVENQYRADVETAKLLNISRAHAVLLRLVNDNADGAPAVVLTDPRKVLGDEWSALLDFWWYIDSMSPEQNAAVDDALDTNTAENDVKDAAYTIDVRDAVYTIDARGAARAACFRDAGWAVAHAAAWASSEIQGADILQEKGVPLFFLTAFGFDSIADIPPRPENYGII